MEIVSSPEALQKLCWSWRLQGESIALVPTMGYFHEGHVSLMRWGREQADKVVASLFVNPTQFGPNEDLGSYPRDMERDKALAAEQGVDVLFAPPSEAMYTPDHSTWVISPEISKHLCGASRPGHFKGVCTIVAKLLLLTLPSLAIFGEKDRQQLAIVTQMVRDLNIPTRIVGRPTARESDGLALSSRNVNLSEQERAQAPFLYKGLKQIQSMAKRGERNVSLLLRVADEFLAQNMPLGAKDYLEIVDARTMAPVVMLKEESVIAAAYKFSRARLIDNVLIQPTSP